MPHFTLFMIFVSTLAISGCGRSPLLHHDKAPSRVEKSNFQLPLPSDQPGAPTPQSEPSTTESNPPTAAPQPAPVNCPLEFPQSGLCASLTWDRTPTGEGEDSFVLRFWSKNQGSAMGPYRDVEGDVFVQLWMPSMGHESSRVTVTRQDPGTYSATRVNFIMPGAWDIRIQIRRGGQIIEQTIQEFHL